MLPVAGGGAPDGLRLQVRTVAADRAASRAQPDGQRALRTQAAHALQEVSAASRDIRVISRVIFRLLNHF